MGAGKARSKLQRKWEIYPGKNKFYCNGRCVSSPDLGGFLACFFLIIVTGGLFFALDCPYLAVNVNPVIPVIGGLLWIFILGCLFQTTFIDPGIIPRATLHEALEIDRLYQLENQQLQETNGTSYQAPRFKEVQIKGRSFKLSYCTTCQIYRPPRASHCSRCNNCVERFDHHCPMVGNCIGKRNYRYFYLFILSTATMCCYIIGCNVTVIVLRSKEMDVGEAFKKSAGSLIQAVICLGSLASVGGLACYHSMLVCKEMTTNEDIKGTYNDRKFKEAVNPYSRGNCVLNCLAVLCGPRHPSLIDRRGFVDPTDETPTMVDTNGARGLPGSHHV
ncbi:hypothetical protein DPMN_081038 [Dreissena polymorpha]|uniref:Palmitoyltransferase n=2 Tax=Dreissena polymorpha TaxID=45954 RepID=A0A9D3Y6P2_DREPO|nr:hypothetical protein DPMN_081038 [Dreissena polymorpha]